jgi:type I restriction enzyme S subunit
MKTRSLVSLSEVGKFIRGITFKPTDVVAFGTTDSAVCMRTKNVQSNLDESDLISIPSSFIKRNEQMLQEGDLLVSSANSWNLVGKCCWVPALRYPATAGGFISIFRPDSDVIDKRYLYHWFTSAPTQSRLRQCSRQTTNISNLSIPLAEKLELPLPPLPEQKRIAAILDKADAIRRKREKAIELTDSFLRSVFLEMFGESASQSARWEVVQLGDLISFLTSGSRGWARYYSEQGDIFLRIQNVANGRLKLEDLTYVNAPASAEGNRTRVQEGDILLSITADLGRTAVIPPGFPTAYINQHLALLRVKGINPFFLSAFLSSPVGQRQIQRLNREGVKAGLNFDDIRSLKITLPPQQIQQKYCDIWNKQTSLLERNKQSLHRLDSLSSSLSAQLFLRHGERKERFSISATLKEEIHAL